MMAQGDELKVLFLQVGVPRGVLVRAWGSCLLKTSGEAQLTPIHREGVGH